MKSEELKELVGKRVHHEKFGDGTIVGSVARNILFSSDAFFIEFDEWNAVLHEGSLLIIPTYGRGTGKPNHCWWFSKDEILKLIKEGKKVKDVIEVEPTEEPEYPMDFISFLRNDYKTSKKEGKIIADFLNLLEEGYVKIECVPKKDEDGLQEVATTSRCYPYLGGEMYQEDGGETAFTLPREKYKSILRKLTNQKEVPEPTEEELEATVNLYYKDKWDAETGQNEAVKKMEKRIKNVAARIINANYKEAIEKLDKRHKGMAGRIFNYTMGEEK